jgi:hypothetical protein
VPNERGPLVRSGPLTLTAEIGGFDPPLTPIRTAYATPPLLAFLDPPIERASRRPGGCLNLDRWIYFPAIRFAVLSRIEIPN